MAILANVCADFAFIGASGLDAEEGCSSTQLFEAEMTRAILSRAKRKILLADGTKWERPSIIRFVDWSALDDWVTDEPRTAKEISKLKSFGLDLHTARVRTRVDFLHACLPGASDFSWRPPEVVRLLGDEGKSDPPGCGKSVNPVAGPDDPGIVALARRNTVWFWLWEVVLLEESNTGSRTSYSSRPDSIVNSRRVSAVELKCTDRIKMHHLGRRFFQVDLGKFAPNACRGERCGVWRTATINPVLSTHSKRRGALFSNSCRSSFS